MEDEWQQEDQEIDGADAGHSRNNSIATRVIEGGRGTAVYMTEIGAISSQSLTIAYGQMRAQQTVSHARPLLLLAMKQPES